MSEDPRCCGSGMCIIDVEGRCWCGQHWDGQQMVRVPLSAALVTACESVASLPTGAADPQSGEPR